MPSLDREESGQASGGETGRLEDFPKVLHDLRTGKIKSRIALLPDRGGDGKGSSRI